MLIGPASSSKGLADVPVTRVKKAHPVLGQPPNGPSPPFVRVFCGLWITSGTGSSRCRNGPSDAATQSSRGGASSVSLTRPTIGWGCVTFAVSILVEAVGLYGIVSYLVSQRTREIGLRMALGAQAHDVVRLVLSQGIHPTLLGMGCGVVGAYFGSRLLQSML